MNLGGTAIGTGITTEYSYRELAIQALGKISGKKIKSAPDLIEATSDMGDFVLLSGLLKRTATKLSKLPMTCVYFQVVHAPALMKLT